MGNEKKAMNHHHDAILSAASNELTTRVMHWNLCKSNNQFHLNIPYYGKRICNALKKTKAISLEFKVIKIDIKLGFETMRKYLN